MQKRDWHYIYPPQAFECTCEKCGGTNLQWSEWKEHIWCNDCKIDFDPGNGITAGIFSGPIAMGVCSLLGLSFDKLLIKENKIQRFNIVKYDWDDNWFTYSWDELAKAMLNNTLGKLDNTYGDISFFKGMESFSCQSNEKYRIMLYEILAEYKSKS